jgi:autotransporter-associated beta strand protein
VVLSGQSDFSGATTIDAGTLEIDNSVIPTTVTINPSGTLQGSGGVQGVVNVGGTFVANLYDVSITTPSLQRGETADYSTGSIALRSGETGLVLAMSEMDAASKELLGSATNTVTGQTYSTDNNTNIVNGAEPSLPAFKYVPSFSAPGVSYTGQALELEDLDGLSYSDYDYNDDYFEISVTRDTTKPVAKDDAYQDGVGGDLVVSASNGMLANDTSQSGAALTVASVNGSTDSTGAGTRHERERSGYDDRSAGQR